MSKKIFTTQDVAQLLSCDLTTVIKWVNAAKLNAYKTPGGHRRIEKADLLEFIKKYDMPMPDELQEVSRVLIVDDDPQFIEMTAAVLGQIENIRLDSAKEGFEAGEKVISFNPHVVILDIKLPGIDGFEVCRRIKDREETAGVKVIAVTAYGTLDDKNRIMECGADHYFQKPVKSEQLISTVKKLLP
ncbi:response regulator [bacterium]|nr:response regulator [bacterium]MBU3955711.1 response regulator [bacterium]MBU4133954.1 response regulator [bacterium]